MDTTTYAPITGRSLRIMPLGDSITDGYTTYPGGYRVALWQRLTVDGHHITFVGSQTNGPAELGTRAHEGHPGWRIDQLDANINTWLRDTDPHIILLLIGTNDMNQNYDIDNAPQRLSQLIDHILAAQPHCELLVATVPPQHNPVHERRLRSYNKAIPTVVARKGPQVHLVDMNDAMTTADLGDAVHPSRAGHERMALVWYDALHRVPAALARTSESCPEHPGYADSR
ncbi:SGNH/GDSL hydrolase family protein [Streptomyces sp. NPDC057307]|uniref:SGNH/GDSL hydrolase family protein n=1 Tax=Streptomyces sp. NPDC057307 TaxID=3346096 RepID=UPI003644F84E